MSAAVKYPVTHDSSSDEYGDDDFESVSDTDKSTPHHHPAAHVNRADVASDHHSHHSHDSHHSHHSHHSSHSSHSSSSSGMPWEKESDAKSSEKASEPSAKPPAVEARAAHSQGSSRTTSRSTSTSSSASASSASSAGRHAGAAHDGVHHSHTGSRRASAAGPVDSPLASPAAAAAVQESPKARYTPSTSATSSRSSSSDGIQLRGAAVVRAARAPAADEEPVAEGKGEAAVHPDAALVSTPRRRSPRKAGAKASTPSRQVGARSGSSSAGGSPAIAAPAESIPRTASELARLVRENESLREEVYQRQRALYHASLSANRTDARRSASRKETAAQQVREAVLLDRAAQMMRRERRELAEERRQLAKEVAANRRALKYRDLVKETSSEIAVLQDENRDLCLEMRCNEKLLLINANVLESGVGAKQLQEEIRARNALVQRQAMHALRDADNAEGQRDALRQRVEALQERVDSRRGADSWEAYADLQALREENRDRTRRLQELKAKVGKLQPHTGEGTPGKARGTSPTPAHPSGSGAEREYLLERIEMMRREVAQLRGAPRPGGAGEASPRSTSGNTAHNRDHQEAPRYPLMPEDAEASVSGTDKFTLPSHGKDASEAAKEGGPALWLDEHPRGTIASQPTPLSQHPASSILSGSARSGRRASTPKGPAAGADAGVVHPTEAMPHPHAGVAAGEEERTTAEADAQPAWLEIGERAAAGAEGAYPVEGSPAGHPREASEAEATEEESAVDEDVEYEEEEEEAVDSYAEELDESRPAAEEEAGAAEKSDEPDWLKF